MNLTLGLKTMFRIWSDSDFADRVRQLTAAPAKPSAPVTPAPAKPARSEALTLLAVLQREGRLVDFLKENITGYSDAEIGAAVRNVHKDCAGALDRIFALQPLRTEAEGASIEVPPGFDPAQVRLTGNTAGQPPFRGKLVHPGWRATQCELPTWTGHEKAALVVAPAEVELK